MNFKFFSTVLLMISTFAQIAFADSSVSSSVTVDRNAQGAVVFKVNSNNGTYFIGSSNGYNPDQLNFHVGTRKAKAVALGLGEAAAAGSGLLIIGGGAYAFFATVVGPATGAGTLFGLGSAITAFSVKAFNSDRWNPIQKYKVAKQLKSVEWSSIKDNLPLTINFNSEESFQNFSNNIWTALSENDWSN